MTASRYRAEVTGKFVQFLSRNPKLVTVRWHSRFKAEYRTKKDALAAKSAYEESGRILWPDDLKAEATPACGPMGRRSTIPQEFRL